MNQELNYKHLYYFWVTAKEGGMSHAADRLGLAVQTVSAQVRLLEQSLGHALFKPAGRGLALTDAGRTLRRKAASVPGCVLDASQCSVKEVLALTREVQTLRDRLQQAVGS